MHTYIRRLTPLALLLCLGMHAATAADLYDVEIIVFSHAIDTDQGESWDSPGDAAGQAGGYAAGGRFTELSSGQFRLKPVSNTLRQGGSYQVLLHRAWRQAPSPSAAYPVRSSTVGVEGSIRLTRGRYLHLDVDLLLRNVTGSGYMNVHRLTEKRRMRSKELHYFDHPRFGMLAQITPYQPPAAPTGADSATSSSPVAGEAGGPTPP